MFHLNGLLAGQASLDRFQREAAALQRLSHTQMEALCSVLDAGDAAELASKLLRLWIAHEQPGMFVKEMLEGDVGALVTFAFELASYRLFMDRLLAGSEPARNMAEAVEREQRGWLRSLIARFRDPASLLPETGDDSP